MKVDGGVVEEGGGRMIDGRDRQSQGDQSNQIKSEWIELGRG